MDKYYSQLRVDENSVYMDDDIDESGTDLSKQVPALFKLGEWYLRKAKANSNSVDFTKANALYNAALVRSRLVNHELGEDEILQRIVETYRTFLYALADNNEDVSTDEIRNEIRHHKDFVANERRMIKERVDEIDSRFDATDKSDEQYISGMRNTQYRSTKSSVLSCILSHILKI